jgi:hypothetical protein
MQIEVLLIVIAKALAELVGLFLLGRGLLYLLAGHKRDTNLFYQVMCVITNPVIRMTRLITPKVVIDRHVPYVAFMLVVWIWVIVVFWVVPEVCGGGTVDCSALLERKREN